MTLKSTAAFGTINHHETQCTWQHEDGNTQPSCTSLMQILLLSVDTLSPPPCPPILNAPEDIHSGQTQNVSADWRDATLSPEGPMRS